jgi:hypothetical protein
MKAPPISAEGLWTLGGSISDAVNGHRSAISGRMKWNEAVGKQLKSMGM